MITPLFRVPSRNSMLLDGTPAAQAARARRAECNRRIGFAAYGFVLVFVGVMLAGLGNAWLAGRL
jgi:hypothetical protein